MNVGIFADSYKPYVSGVVRSLELLERGLSDLGHRPYIFAPDYPEVEPAEDADNVFRFYALDAPTHDSYRLAIPLSLRLRSTVDTLDLDLIHIHSPFMLGRLGARSAQLHDLPLVFTHHTMYHLYTHYIPGVEHIPGADEWLRDWTIERVQEFGNRCDAIVAPSDSIKTHLKQTGVSVPIQVIPTGIDTTSLLENADERRLRREMDIDDDVPVLLYSGRLGQEKGLDLLLEAFHWVLQAEPEARLALVGGGPYRVDLEAKATELGVGDEVHFVGEVEPHEVGSYYLGADVFVFPSQTETQGLAVVEAMSAGLPIVAVEAYGIADVVDDGRVGFLTPAEPQVFAQQALTLIREPDMRRRMGDAARDTAADYSAETMVGRIVELYERVCQGATWRGVG